MCSWSASDTRELRRLMDLARGQGIVGSIVSEEEASEAWSLLGELENHTMIGAMTDASRRLRDETELEMQQAPIIRAKAKAKSMAAPAMIQPPITTDDYTVMPPAEELTEHEIQAYLPPGMPSFEQWSRTVIKFGKYKKENASYQEVLDADPGYARWIITHDSEGNNPLFRDLAAFFKVAVHQQTHSGSYFPGSSIPREFK